jgi:Flp pilus assembly protein TadD
VADPRELHKRAFEHLANDRVAEAIAAWREALALDPTLAIAWNGLGMALAQMGDLDGAIEAGRRLVELEPDDPLSHTSLSLLYVRKGMVPEAEAEKAIAMRLQLAGKGSR